MLKREFGSRLGATGDEYIGYTIEGALRMEQLLKDLRAYTLAYTSGLEPGGDVDSGESLDKALANLAVAIKESGASITRSTCLVSACMISIWNSSSRIPGPTPTAPQNFPAASGNRSDNRVFPILPG
jgi:light-regulated signal transduction histidine kinase (bacteriophytochrome)